MYNCPITHNLEKCKFITFHTTPQRACPCAIVWVSNSPCALCQIWTPGFLVGQIWTWAWGNCCRNGRSGSAGAHGHDSSFGCGPEHETVVTATLSPTQSIWRWLQLPPGALCPSWMSHATARAAAIACYLPQQQLQHLAGTGSQWWPVIQQEDDWGCEPPLSFCCWSPFCSRPLFPPPRFPPYW